MTRQAPGTALRAWRILDLPELNVTIFAFLLNYPWEFLQVPFFDGMAAAPHRVAETLVFCEVPDPVAGLREIRRVLKPDGVLLMLEHVRPAGWLGRVADAGTALSAPIFGEHFNRNAEASVREAGFDVRRKQWLWRDAVVLLVARRRLA